MIFQFLKSSTGVLLADLAAKGFGFLLILVLTFILTPEDLGKYNAVFTAASSLFALSGWGVPIILQRQSASSDPVQRAALGQMIAAGITIMFVAMTILMGILAILDDRAWNTIFPGLPTQIILWVPLLTICYFLVQSPLSLLLGLSKFRIYSLRTATEAAITFVSVVTGAYYRHLIGAIIGLAIALIINMLITVIILHRALIIEKIAISFSRLRQNIQHILSQGAPYFIGNTLMGSLANLVMIALFANHIGYDELGYLRVAMSVVAIMAVIPNAAKTVTITYVARFKEASTYMKSLQIRYLFFTLIVTTGIMSLLLYPVVTLLFGEKYIEGISLYRMILYLHVIFNVHQILNGFIVGQGLLKFSGAVSTVMVILFILFMGLCIPLIGIEGYYLAFGVCYLFGVIVLVHREIREDNYQDAAKLKYGLITSIVVVLMLMIIAMIPIDAVVRYMLEAGFLIVYAIWHARFAFPAEELTKIWSVLRSNFKVT